MSWIGVGKGLEKSMIELQGKRYEFIQNLIDQHRRKMKGSRSKEKNKTLIEVLLSLQQTESEFFKDEIIKGLVLASPIMFGNRRLSIEVRQGNNKFSLGKNGFRNDSFKGRKNYNGGNRGYRRNDFDKRGEFFNRAKGNKGYSNRGEKTVQQKAK